MADIRPLPSELMSEIQELQAKSAAFFKLDMTAAPESIVDVINGFVRQAKTDNTSLEEDDVVGIGVLLGEQYVRKFNWHWGHVNHEEDANEDNYYVCILPADNSLSINPIWWINNMLTTSVSTNILLNFNMVAANKVPAASPNEALGIY